MKHYIKKTVAIVTLLFSFTVNSVEKGKYTSNENINLNYHFNNASVDNTLYIHNINGSINIEGYEGDEIMVDIDKTISATSDSNLQLGMHETWFKVVQHESQMHMFVKTPFNSLKIDGSKVSFNEQNKDRKYSYKLNYKIKVPKNTNLNLVTINDGDIDVKNIQTNTIKAKNINGEIHLDEVSATMGLMTINGDISLSYIDKYISDSSFESVNGSFDINFIEKPSIEITYETLNGDFYSNIEATTVSTFLKKSIKKKKTGVKYKLKPRKKIIIGTGNTKFTFKTLNGDITITEKT